MKKEMLVALLAIGFIFAGVVSASAGVVSWQLVESTSYAGNSPGTDNKLCTSDDGSTNCNLDPVALCASLGSPTKGSCSYAELTFQMASSCTLANDGQACTSNANCGGGVCVPCSPNPGVTFFGNTGIWGGQKGQGYYEALTCENGFDITKISLGTSEVIGAVGGSCMTLDTFNSSSGCGVGLASTSYDVDLWTSTVGSCGFPAGVMPGLNLSGRIMATTATAGACGYTTTQLNNIVSTAGLSGYLSVLCGSGTLPTDLQAVCIPGAPWSATIIASTSSAIPTECASTCPEACTGGAAEGVE
jgi:hypothetical protein